MTVDQPPWPRFAPEFALDAGRTALVLVDVQRGYLERGGGLVEHLVEHHPEIARYYLERVERGVLPGLASLLAAFRERGWPVVFVTFAASLPDGSDWLPLRRQRDEQLRAETGRRTALLHLGEEEAEIVGPLAPRPGELVVNKVSRGAFASTGLEALLRNMGVTGLAVGGVVTNVCVETTAREASDRGLKVVLLSDACAGYDASTEATAFSVFSSIFGRVSRVDEVLRELGADRHATQGGGREPAHDQAVGG